MSPQLLHPNPHELFDVFNYLSIDLSSIRLWDTALLPSRPPEGLL